MMNWQLLWYINVFKEVNYQDPQKRQLYLKGKIKNL